MNDKPIYKVLTNHEVPELSKIEKSNIKVEITLADTLQAIEYNKKQIEALKAELELKKALVANVTTNYPDVVNIDEKMQIACHTYYEAGRFIKIAEDKLVEFHKAQEELQQEVDEITVQTGIEKMPVEKKIEAYAKIQKKLDK
jgi:heterodisulfide reductase subunit A-like polyferredoxin